MPTVAIPAGETRELISGNPGDVFFVSVESGEIRVGPSESVARLGRPLGDDDRGELTLRERQEEIHAFASGSNDASVIIERQGFEINLFSRKIIRRPGDSASEDLQLETSSAFISTGVAPGNSDTTGLLTNDTEDTWFVEQASWSSEPTGRDYIEVNFEIIDADFETIHEIALVHDSYVNFDPAVAMRPGESFAGTIFNHTGQEVLPYFTVNWRTE